MADLPEGALKTGRRTFLRWATGVGAVVSAALAGLPAVRAFFSPVYRRPKRTTWVRLGEADQFEPDIPTKVDFVATVTDAWVENRVLRSVWVYTHDGENFIVYNGRCTHLGCGFGYDKDANRFRCPCHLGVFDLETGKVLGGPPPRPLDRLEVKVEEGGLYAAYEDFRVGIAGKVAV
ncbi:MAG TPA: ubiquinol-cytochrome c reductase iron-sulfur subunit [Gemmatimonadales bacterium]|nr:ubiquinol-cytochrome c reductase iron-sulfur subunit [Gemmatimonadales bacterium]